MRPTPTKLSTNFSPIDFGLTHPSRVCYSQHKVRFRMIGHTVGAFQKVFGLGQKQAQRDLPANHSKARPELTITNSLGMGQTKIDGKKVR